MKKILITGASGFIGRACLDQLDQNQFEVHAISRKVNTSKDIHWHQLDLLNHEACCQLVRKLKPSHLLHCAWVTDHGAYWHCPTNLDWVAASLHLLRAFAESGGQKIVVAGTCAEYDWSFGVCNEEQTPLNPSTLYGASKNALQGILEKFAIEAQLEYAWARLFFVYGPYEYKQRLIPYVITRLLNQAEVCCSHGGQLRDFIHVRDAAAILVSLLERGCRGVFNVGSGFPVSIRDVVLKINELFDGPSDIVFSNNKCRYYQPIHKNFKKMLIMSFNIRFLQV